MLCNTLESFLSCCCCQDSLSTSSSPDSCSSFKTQFSATSSWKLSLTLFYALYYPAHIFTMSLSTMKLSTYVFFSSHCPVNSLREWSMFNPALFPVPSIAIGTAYWTESITHTHKKNASLLLEKQFTSQGRRISEQQTTCYFLQNLWAP